jgi:hypothetical protein
MLIPLSCNKEKKKKLMTIALFLHKAWYKSGTCVGKEDKEIDIPLHHCGERCPSAFNSFELPSWMLYQDVQLLWDSGLVRGESDYLL